MRHSIPNLNTSLVATLGFLAFGAVALLLFGRLGQVAAQDPADPGALLLVNTTADMEVDWSHCTVSEEGEVAPCPLRTALEKAGATGGEVRIAWCSETTDDAPCIDDADPNYDPAIDRWRFPIELEFPHVITGTGATIDLAAGIPDWTGPADNRVLLDTVDQAQDWIVAVEGRDITLRGFDLTGEVAVGALAVRNDNSGGLFDGLAVYDLVGTAFHFRDDGTVQNRLRNSWCGVRDDGKNPAPVTGPCVELEIGASNNIIGGPEADDGNTLCNALVGVRIMDAETRGNTLEGNRIGLDLAGGACGHSIGVLIEDEAKETTIRGNIISGNLGDGIAVESFTFDTVIEDNRIGLAPTAHAPRPNAAWGIRLADQVKRTTIRSNAIAFNEGGGIRVRGGFALQNTIIRNQIFAHGGHDAAISIEQGANGGIDPPRLNTVDGVRVSGRACADCTVELFSDPAGEARRFEAEVETGASGIFVTEIPGGTTYGTLTGTATDPETGTSELAQPITFRPDPTATPYGPTPTPDPDGDHEIQLPWLARDATR